jgi:sterol desaturase/sphingolipid hydroxylase (fatty acid hydroxylase superfamily)
MLAYELDAEYARSLYRRREKDNRDDRFVRAVFRSILAGCFLEAIMLGTILLILLVLLLLGALPAWPYSQSWGYYPSGGFGVVVIILLILFFTGRL